MEFKKLLQRLSDRLPVSRDLLTWTQRELYPAVKYLHEAFNYNVEVVKEKLAAKADKATPVPGVYTQVTVNNQGIVTYGSQAPTGPTGPGSEPDDKKFKVTSSDGQADFANSKLVFMHPLKAHVAQYNSTPYQQIVVGLDETASDPAAGATYYPARLVTRGAPSTAANPTSSAVADQVVALAAYELVNDSPNTNESSSAVSLTLPNDPTYVVTGVSLVVNVPFYANGISAMHVNIRGEIEGQSTPTLGDTLLIPNSSQRVYYQMGYDVSTVNSYAGQTWTSDLGYSMPCKGQQMWASVKVGGVFFRDLLQGALQIQVHLERRSAENCSNMYAYDQSIFPPGTKTQKSEAFQIPCPIPPAYGRKLIGLKMIADVPWGFIDRSKPFPHPNLDDVCYARVEDYAGNIIIPDTDVTNLPGNDANFSYYAKLVVSTGVLSVDYSASRLRLILTARDTTLANLGFESNLKFEHFFEDTTDGSLTVDGYALLTGPQLTSEGADTATDELSVTTVAPSTVTFGQSFASIAGTPGVTSIPAGPFTFNVLGRVSGNYVGVTNNWVVTMAVWRNGQPAPDPPFLTATSGPLSNTSDEISTFSADLAAPVSVAALDLIVYELFAKTDGSSMVTFWAVYNELARRTNVQTTIAGSSGVGTIIHASTLLRDAAGSHPDGAITFPVASAVAISSNKVVLPTGYRSVIVTGGGDLNAIEGQLGDIVRIFFAPSGIITIKHMASVAAPSYPFYNLTFGTGTNQDLTVTEFMASIFVQLVDLTSYSPGKPCWVMISGNLY